jgi:hypothetical protein
MSSKLLCDPYLWESPRAVLYTPIFPTEYTACVSDRLNHIILVFVLLLASGAAVAWKTQSRIPTIIAALLALLLSGQSLIVILQIFSRKEGFQNSGYVDVIPNVNVIGKKNAGIESLPTECLGVNAAAYECKTTATEPSARNPFMNVLVDELKYNPTRPAAASVLDPTVQISMDEFFKTEFYSDPTDVFGKNQGQRQWVTMPSTSIPNDVDSYQNWLYKIPGKTCKEAGGAACLPGTDGAVIPWLNRDRNTMGSDEAEAAIVNRYPSPYNGNDTGSNSPQLLAGALQAQQKFA